MLKLSDAGVEDGRREREEKLLFILGSLDVEFLLVITELFLAKCYS